jgi:hypothetical protein
MSTIGSRASMSFPAATALTIVLITSLALNLFGNDFPTVYHIDELKKLDFISNWQQDFMHPILLLQVVRVPNQCLEFDSPQSLAKLGRSMVGLAGMALVALAYFLTRRAYSERISLVIAASIAFCPTVVIHSHYIKEDILLTACLLASLIAISRFSQSPTLLHGYLMGIAFGFAFSSHYKSILLVPLTLAFCLHEVLLHPRPLVELTTNGQTKSKQIVLPLLVAWLVSIAVFFTINSPALTNWDVFMDGIAYEAKHAREGHSGIRIYPIDQWFTFHLRNNLLPGMTTPLCLWGLAGLVAVLTRWRAVSPVMRLIAFFTIFFYLVPEISPTKPPPDDGRYVIPVAVGMLCCVAELLRWSASYHVVVGRSVFLALGLSSSWALLDSSLLCWNLERDTRAIAYRWTKEQLPSQASVVFGRHAIERELDDRQYLSIQNPMDAENDFLVVSSFQYDRFLDVANLPGQDSRVYEKAEEFRNLFELPFKEFRPAYRSFAFSNPVIRVVQLGKKFQLPNSLSSFEKSNKRLKHEPKF